MPDTSSSAYKRRLRSNLNAPNVGEFNSRKVSPFLEPDPNLDCKYANGVIVIATETRQLLNHHRHKSNMGTMWDNKCDISWHAKGSQLFAIAAIVTNGEESVEVPNLDALQVRGQDGNLVTQELLDSHLSYLNGKTMIGNFSSKSTIGRANQGQRSVTRINEVKESLGQSTSDHLEARDRRRILDNFDRQFLQVIIVGLYRKNNYPIRK